MTLTDAALIFVIWVAIGAAITFAILMGGDMVWVKS